jgi:hypothetical protein
MLLLGLTLVVANSSSAAPIAISRPTRSKGEATEMRIQVVLVDIDEINSVAPSFVENCYVEALALIVAMSWVVFWMDPI